MSNTIQQIRERRATLSEEVKNICEQNPGATWNAEHQVTYDARMTDIERATDEINRLEKVYALDAERQVADAGVVEHKGVRKVDEKHAARYAMDVAFMRGGETSLSDEQRGMIVRNTMSTGVTTEGGFTVSNPVIGNLIEAMKAHGGMRLTSAVLRTAQGNTFSMPTNDDTGSTGEILGENASSSDLDTSFGTVSMPVYNYSSKVFAVPYQLVMDSEIDIEGLIVRLCGTRIYRITNQHFTTGTGTAQPRGIATAASLGKAGITGQTLTVSHDDLVTLEHSIDPAYRELPGVGYMMNDDSLRVIRLIKDSAGRPIFVPGYEVGNPEGAPSRIMGRPVFVNQSIAVMGANAKSILFGVLSNYTIRDVMDVTMWRFGDSAYAKKGQIGFMAHSRHGGNLLDINGSTVKFFQNSAT